MRDVLRIAALVLVVLVLAVRQTSASGSSSVSGQVVDATSHKPVAGARIEVFADPAPPRGAYALAFGQTRKDGSFHVSVSAGKYRLQVLKMGYSVQELSGLSVEEKERLIIGEPVGLVAASSEDMMKMACNSIVRPEVTGDVYVVCAGK